VVGGELAQGLQEPEPPAERARVDRDHRPLHQVAEQAVDVDGVETVVGRHRLGRGEVEWAGEHRQPLEQQLLAGREQVVGPPDRGPQRAVPVGAGPPPTRQQAKAGVEPGQQL
jgi:hypothetical protein